MTQSQTNPPTESTSTSDTKLDHLLLQIEAVSVFVVQNMRLALRRALTGKDLDTLEYDFEKMKVLLESPTVRLNMYDLASTAPYWQAHIPDNPTIYAKLAHAIINKYSLCRPEGDAIANALKLDNETVQESYQTLYGDPIESCYADVAPLDERPFWLRLDGIAEPNMLYDLVAELDWHYVPSGEYLFREGELGESMGAVITGRLRVTIDRQNGEEVLTEVGRGAIIGEMATLTKEHHRTANVYAIRDSEVILLGSEGIRQLTMKHPHLGFAVMQEIVERTRRSYTQSLMNRTSQLATIAIVPSSPDVDTKLFSEKFTKSLSEFDTAYHIDSKSFDAELGQGASQLPETDERNGYLVSWLTNLELANRFVILEADAALTQWTQRCLRTADRILIVTDGTKDPQLGTVERAIRQDYGKQIVANQELIILHPDRNATLSNINVWLQGRDVVRHHNISLSAPKDMQRLARLSANRGIGLVLGGGGARGMAHIGMLRALEEKGIPIDTVGGTSFGAIIAATIAYEWGWQSVFEKMRDFAANTKHYFRYTLPILSLMDGKTMDNFFQKFYGLGDIEDLWINFYCLASNISTGQPVVLDRGAVWHSVRASMSIPSVFPPVKIDKHVLVDGGVLNNLPTDVMKSRLGDGLVIGSHVISSEDSAFARSLDDAPTPWRILFNRLNPFEKTMVTPNIIDSITETMSMSSRISIDVMKQNCNILVEHPVSQYGIFEYDKVDEIVEIGYQATLKQLVQAGY